MTFSKAANDDSRAVLPSRRGTLALGAMLGLGGLAARASPARAETSGPAPRPGLQSCCPVVELRQYTLHQNKRDVLIELFEREFIESQEAVGIKVIGHFRDLDDPDRFVWLRGFPDMPARAKALNAFYFGPVWQAHRDEANPTMIDSDNVLLLKPTHPEAGFAADRLASRPPAGARGEGPGIMVAGIQYLDADMVDAFAAFFDQRMAPHLAELGLAPIARFVTETSENTFSRLPIRERDRVLVWFAVVPDLKTCDRRLEEMRRSQVWREGAPDPILHQLERKPEILRLRPTARSALHG